MTTRQDAVDLLKADHQEVTGLFEAFGALLERDASDIEKSALAEQICLLLSIHAQVLEEVFYPAVTPLIGDGALTEEARVDHAAVKGLIAEISVMKPSDSAYDAKLAALGEATGNHVKEEQGNLFPKVRKSNVDLMALGAKLHQRKNELMAQYKDMLGGREREDESADPVGRQTNGDR